MERDLQKERDAVGLFGQKYGRTPNLENPDERREVYQVAYGTDLPAELRGTMEESASMGGVNSYDVPPVESSYADTSRINELGQQVGQAQAQGQQMATPNESLRIFQEALRAKTNIGNQKVGTSEIFQQAGLTGMGALQGSLSARQKEMQMNQTEFNNLVGQMAGHYKDMMMQNKMNYDMVADLYNQEMKRLVDIENFARKNEAQKDLIMMEHELQVQRINLEQSQSDGDKINEAHMKMRKFIQDNSHLTDSELDMELRAMKDNNNWSYITDGDIQSAITGKFSENVFEYSSDSGAYGQPDNVFAQMAMNAQKEDAMPKTEIESAKRFVEANNDKGDVEYLLRKENEKNNWDLSETELKIALNEGLMYGSLSEEERYLKNVFETIKKETKDYADKEISADEMIKEMERWLKVDPPGEGKAYLGEDESLSDLSPIYKKMLNNVLISIYGKDEIEGSKGIFNGLFNNSELIK